MQVSVLTPMKNDKPSGCGCLGGGCVIAFLVVLLIVGALVWGGWSTYSGLRSMTSTTLRPVATYNATPQQYQQVAAKVKAFETAYHAGEETTLTLTADEINTLIARDPDWADLKGHVFVTMHGNRMATQVGASLTQIRTFENRYFNGEASMSFTSEKGKPRPVSVSVKANGNELPNWLISYFTSMDFLDGLDWPGNVQKNDALANLLSLEVRDDQLIIRAKKQAP